LSLFFAGYLRFSYDSHTPVSAQYGALCRLCGFSRCKLEYGGARSEREVAYAGYQRAMVLSFGTNYGTDVNDLGSLQSLAKVLQIDPGYGRAIRTAHVNLVDLVDYGTSEGRSPPPTIFGTLIGLRVYTKTTRKVFPQGRGRHAARVFAGAYFLSS
ncbi:hypothetical protein B0H14DRAFT_2374998, partial [Mycena olivaceomarginata]